MDPHRLPLANLANLHQKMESLQQFISASLRNNTLLGKEDMEMVSTEISSAIHQVIVNGAALISTTITTQQSQNPPCSQFGDGVAQVADLGVVDPPICSSFKGKPISDLQGLLKNSKDEEDEDCELVELDEVELLAEHVHFCEICGKGFKRDANLRMHMRAHGNRFKTLEALAKPDRFITDSSARNHKTTRFSCPFVGCNRNKSHGKFRPLKSAICVKNHFKRTHCPKMFSCNRCNKKSFSVVGDLKNHLKHCGEAESRWRCSCGNSFSRKDKLFGHLALFEGHMPAINVADEGERSKATTTAMEEEGDDDDDDEEEEETHHVDEGESAVNGGTEGVDDQLFWDDLQQGGFGGFGNEDCLDNVFDSPTELARTVDGWFQM